MNSYQKIKKERDLLKKQLSTVIVYPDGVLAMELKAKYTMSNRIEHMCWSGTSHTVIVNPKDWL